MSHIREHQSVLASAEKRLLVFTAERLPGWVSSDALSALGLASMACAGVSFAAFRWAPRVAALVVVLSLLVNWFGDSLDGTVARVRRQERPRFGFYVDHAIDMAGSALLLSGMACSTLVNPVVAFALLSAFLLTAGEAFLAAHTVGVFRLSFLRVGPTELRIAIAAGAARAAYAPNVTIAGYTWKLFDVACSVGAIGLAVAFVAAAVRHAVVLHGADPMTSAASHSGTARGDASTVWWRLGKTGAGTGVRSPR